MKERFAEIQRFFAGMNKRYLLFGLLIVLIFIGFSVTRCVDVHAPVAAPEQTEQEGQAEQSGSVSLNSEQQAIYDSYDEKTRSFVDYLCANTWVAGNDEKVLHFTDQGFEEASGNDVRSVPFVVSALEESSSNESGVNGESSTITTFSAAILTDEGTQLLTVRKFYDNLTKESDASVTSSAFSLSDSYVLGDASGGVNVTGMGSSFDNLIDGKSGDLIKTVQDYCAQHYPTASTAEWSAMADWDFKEGTVSTSFILDNDAKSVVWVTYRTDTQTFEVTRS